VRPNGRDCARCVRAIVREGARQASPKTSICSRNSHSLKDTHTLTHTNSHTNTKQTINNTSELTRALTLKLTLVHLHARKTVKHSDTFISAFHLLQLFYLNSHQLKSNQIKSKPPSPSPTPFLSPSSASLEDFLHQIRQTFEPTINLALRSKEIKPIQFS